MLDYEITRRFVSILTKRFSQDELHQILEAITADYEYGSCPLCGCDEVPFDAQGRKITGADVSSATWREVHDDYCPVTLIEQSFRKRPAKKGVATHD